MKLLYAYKMVGVSVLTGFALTILLLFFAMYPTGEVMVSANLYHEYFFEFLLLIVFLPGGIWFLQDAITNNKRLERTR